MQRAPKRRTRPVGWVVLASVAAAPSGCAKKEAHPSAPLLVAAAADLAFAFPEIGKAYERTTGHKVTFTFGSTGLLAKQIAEGAPYGVFAAANAEFVDDVARRGACDGSSRSIYGRGRVALWARSSGDLPSTLAALADSKYAKIAIANPEHAPYGRAARDAMVRAGVWHTVMPRVVYGENVQQTLQFAQSGNADVAIIALSLATAAAGSYAIIDASMHDAIDQTMVVCGPRGTPAFRAAVEFTRFVNSELGRAVMRRYGFLLPAEATSASLPSLHP